MSRPPDLSASLVRKGEATPVSPEHAVTGASREPEPVPSGPPARPAPRRAAPPARVVEVDPPHDIEEPRSAVTTRLTLATQERIRILAFKRRCTKQAIIDEALAAFLDSQKV
jgi:hypothetical protein